jgi:diadenosine tetraphosphate (Ap4A) HIT family hydrolase
MGSTHEGNAKPAGAAGDCPFCSPEVREKAVRTHGSVIAIRDASPVSDGHLLVVPARHTPDLFTMTPAERTDAMELVEALRESARTADPTITGFTVGINCGASAGQRIPHAHIHFIPRRDSDADGRRGLKGVIRNRLAY